MEPQDEIEKAFDELIAIMELIVVRDPDGWNVIDTAIAKLEKDLASPIQGLELIH